MKDNRGNAPHPRYVKPAHFQVHYRGDLVDFI